MRAQPAENVYSCFSYRKGIPLHLPQDLPVTLPSKLVDQRPDVRAAESHLHATSAEICVAFAARLPAIFVDRGCRRYRPRIRQPRRTGQRILDVGRQREPDDLRRRNPLVQAADRRSRLRSGYGAMVIAALQNVADSLRALQSYDDALSAAAAAQQAASARLPDAKSSWEASTIYRC
jgi:outer membrane protein TolC